MKCSCGCGADSGGRCWKTSEDVPCVVCEKTPCEYQVGGEPVCSFEHGLKILCGSIASIRPLSDY
jgi:hypothetical protein